MRSRVAKTGLLGDCVHGVAALFDQHASSFDAQVLDRSRRRLACLSAKCPAELPRA